MSSKISRLSHGLLILTLLMSFTNSQSISNLIDSRKNSKMEISTFPQPPETTIRVKREPPVKVIIGLQAPIYPRSSAKLNLASTEHDNGGGRQKRHSTYWKDRYARARGVYIHLKPYRSRYENKRIKKHSSRFTNRPPSNSRTTTHYHGTNYNSYRPPSNNYDLNTAASSNDAHWGSSESMFTVVPLTNVMSLDFGNWDPLRAGYSTINPKTIYGLPQPTPTTTSYEPSEKKTTINEPNQHNLAIKYGQPEKEPTVDYGLPQANPTTNHGQHAKNPPTNYGPPQPNPTTNYAPPQHHPANNYDPKLPNPTTDYEPPQSNPITNYGLPEEKPPTKYGPPNYEPPQSNPITSYGLPEEKPPAKYGPPNYEPPQSNPITSYGLPEEKPPTKYGPPNYEPPQSNPITSYGLPEEKPPTKYGPPNYEPPQPSPPPTYGPPGQNPPPNYGISQSNPTTTNVAPPQPILNYGPPEKSPETDYGPLNYEPPQPILNYGPPEKNPEADYGPPNYEPPQSNPTNFGPSQTNQTTTNFGQPNEPTIINQNRNPTILPGPTTTRQPTLIDSSIFGTPDNSRNPLDDLTTTGPSTTSTQHRFSLINSNLPNAVRFKESFRRDPGLSQRIILNPDGITCSDVCGNGEPYVTHGLLGLCTSHYCNCRVELLVSRKTFRQEECPRGHVFDPTRAVCDVPQNSILCSDNPVPRSVVEDQDEGLVRTENEFVAPILSSLRNQVGQRVGQTGLGLGQRGIGLGLFDSNVNGGNLGGNLRTINKRSESIQGKKEDENVGDDSEMELGTQVLKNVHNSTKTESTGSKVSLANDIVSLKPEEQDY